MSNFPTIEKTIESLLNHIIALKPPEREAVAKPAIYAFISHPIIQPMLSTGKAPSYASLISKTMDLADIQKTLTTLAKAIEDIQKPSTTPSKQTPPLPLSKEASKTTLCSYSAVAGIRPPNPSLVVDLSHLNIAEKDQLWLEILCDAINRKLSAIVLPQVKLAAIRWTAKGNLVITSAPSATPHTLQIAMPHISTTISTSLQLLSDAITSQPQPNVK
jgi:hypothetical protein